MTLVRCDAFVMAGVGFSLEAPEAPFMEQLRRDWSPFRSATKGSWRATVEFGDYGEGAVVEPRVLPVLAPTGDGLEMTGPDFEARLTPSTRTLRIRQRPGRFPTETLIKMMLAEALAEEGGLLLHAVAVATPERGAVFVGASGAGKSTLGRLSEDGGLLRLADELVAITPERGGYACKGTPWNVGRAASARLAFMGRLGWASEPSMTPCSGSELLRLTLSNALLVNASPEGRARQFRSVSRLLSEVPTVELKFGLDTRVAGKLREELGGR